MSVLVRRNTFGIFGFAATILLPVLWFSSESAGQAANPTNSDFRRSTNEPTSESARPPLLPLHDVPDNGLVRSPPMGWNSWNKLHRYVTDTDVREMADTMVASGMVSAGYVYVNIDDTWEGSRDAEGNITTNNKFPDMKALAAYIHSRGLKIGIYSSPGPKTCADYEGSYGHEEQDAKQFAIWEIDYLKYDWCSGGSVYREQDMQAVYQKMGDALLKAGRPIVYSLCQYGVNEVWKWGAKVGANLWRTTSDIADNWKSLDEIGFGSSVPGQHTQLEIFPFTKAGHFNDPDMLEVGNGGMTDDEYRLHMSLWSLLSAPLLAGNDLRTMTDETKGILLNTELIAVDQDKALSPPKRIFGSDTDHTSAVSIVLAKTLSDGSVAVGMFNRSEQPLTISVTWKSLGLTGKTVQVRGLWAHRSAKIFADGYTAYVPKHGVVMLRLSEK
jgi:alpha-galactosidase